MIKNTLICFLVISSLLLAVSCEEDDSVSSDPLVLVSSNIVDDQEDVAVNTTFQLTFNNPLSGSFPDSEFILIDREWGDDIALTAIVNGNVLTLTPARELYGGDNRYRLLVAGITDVSGGVAPTVRTDFKTRNNPPQPSFSLISSTLSTECEAFISVNFGADLDPLTADDQAFNYRFVNNATGSENSLGAYNYSDGVVTVGSRNNLDVGVSYTLKLIGSTSLGTRLATADKNYIESDVTFNFTPSGGPSYCD